MMKYTTTCFLALLFFHGWLSAQTAPGDLRQADFSASPENNGGATLSPVLPPLMQKAGAPNAHYQLYWEFGDGYFSFSPEKKTTHYYERPGEYLASIEATNYYDDGKKPLKKKKPVKIASARNSAMAAVEPLPTVLEAGARQSIALKTSAQPKSGEELTCILSYRNMGKVTTDGKLHLFFNEKKFPAAHFRFLESRTPFGETEDAAYSAVFERMGAADLAETPARASSRSNSLEPSEALLPPFPVSEPEWAAFAPPIILEEMMKTATDEFREQRSWKFNALRPGESRNLFVSLLGAASMIRDTSATIHLAGVFEPFDPALAPERFTLEVEIVASHDPNRISVSDNRVNYRLVKAKKLDYTVRFQNNGEGPASTVQLTVRVPDGLNLAKMRPLEWQPKCPICPKTPTKGSCLDTASVKDGLQFTFRNIYLPGSRQTGVSEFDSTKGYLRYRIEPEPRMPKRTFKSQAEIVFDKNPPIRTNFSKTSFKTGISPGIKAGYAFAPDSISDGYFFLGASLSPYQSWRIYPQIELLTGFRGRQDQGVFFHQDTLLLDQTPDTKIFEVRDSTVQSSRGFVSFEVPFLLRKNFNRFFGIGIGGAARIFLDNGSDRSTSTRTRYRKVLGQTITQISKPQTVDYGSRSYTATRTQYTLFTDLTLGSVRTGPNLGIRVGGILRDGFQPFAQVSLEIKL